MTEAVIYNITTSVSPAVEAAWLQWMQDIHIPQVLGTGCFQRHQLVKVLAMDDAGGATYAVQYYAKNIAGYNRYQSEYAGRLNNETAERWRDQALSFSTLMGVVQ